MSTATDPTLREKTYLQDGLYDADSHIMEPVDWLEKHAAPSLVEKLADMPIKSVGGIVGKMVKLSEAGAHLPDVAKALEANILSGPKAYAALGAFNAAERSRTLDILDIKGQIQFTTFASLQFIRSKDDDVLYGGLRAHNEAMAEWCARDARLHGCATTVLRDEERGYQEAKWAIENGCRAVLTPTAPFGKKSPAHPDFDRLWRLLVETRTPFILHIGLHSIREGYTNNGRKSEMSFVGSGEGITAKDIPIVHHWPEEFLTAMIIDGVLERFPALKIGVIEYGADWMPSFMRRLDHAAHAFRKSEPHLLDLKRKPSEQIIDQVRVTPYVFEDVGRMIRDSSDRIYMFSTDYPHIEGGKDPIGRMDASMEGISDTSKRRYFRENYQDLFHGTC
jgi:predicted TIM-barrel fold metal-dependent hydrolase